MLNPNHGRRNCNAMVPNPTGTGQPVPVAAVFPVNE